MFPNSWFNVKKYNLYHIQTITQRHWSNTFNKTKLLIASASSIKPVTLHILRKNNTSVKNSPYYNEKYVTNFHLEWNYTWKCNEEWMEKI